MFPRGRRVVAALVYSYNFLIALAQYLLGRYVTAGRVSYAQAWSVRVTTDHPRDAQRDFSKRAEKQRVDLGEEQVILCHTDGVLRE